MKGVYTTTLIILILRFLFLFFAKACALAIAVIMQDDMLTAIQRFYAGHDPALNKDLPGATYFKWMLSTLSQMISALIYLVVIFILVMQSDNVIGMYLNFAALSFISDIDDYVYNFGSLGFISSSVKKCCEDVGNVKLRRNGSHIGRLINRIVILFTLLGLTAGYSFIVHKQLSHSYACKKLFIQFGDEASPSASLLSGEFLLMDRKIAKGALSYVEKEHGSMLTRCAEKGAWTFTRKGKDPCDEYDAISEKTEQYNVIKFTGWQSWDSSDHILSSFTSFILECNDCKSGDRGTCPEKRGECVDNICVCKEDYFGLNCLFPGLPCEHLTLEQIRGEQWQFPKSGSGTQFFTSEYNLLKYDNGSFVISYGLPVYYYDEYDDLNVSDIMLFLGRRWYISDTWNDGDDDFLNAYNKSRLIYFLENEFGLDTIVEKMNNIFVSGPMDYGTPSYGPSPVGLKWYPLLKKEPFEVQRIDTINELHANFLCGVCHNETNPCKNNKKCIDGKCACGNYYSGELCEKKNDCCQNDNDENCELCVHSGTCDSYNECNCTADVCYRGDFCHVYNEKWC